jgi:hypothetical protein
MKTFVDSIYLISDGDPTGGISNSKEMEEYIMRYNKIRKDKKKQEMKINVICFMLGGEEKKVHRRRAIEFLSHIASISEGTYRAVDDKLNKN